MTMDKHPEQIAERAAAYFVRRRGETAAQRREREAWLAGDERHAGAYADAQRLWDRVGELRANARLQALKAADLAAMRRSRWLGPGRLLLAAAALVVLLGSAYLVTMFAATPSPARYVTQLGERRTETLADGTRVVLNTDTALEVRYTRGRRDVSLLRGEAQFEVEHDAARPFVVHVDGDTVTALGTRFQVRRNADAVVVTLLRGSVEVVQGQQQRILHPDEQAHLSPGAGIRIQAIDPAQVTGWPEGWLRFRNASLGQVVAEANRYSPRKLKLGGAALAGLKLNGNFRAGDNASIALAAGQILPVRVDDRGTEIVLRSK
jgi:transmembrane sensor